MSSLRLALKQSLQEAGPLFKEKKKKTKSSNALKQKRRPRQPGDPPRKRGRPRKHPRPEDVEHGEDGPDAATRDENDDDEEEHASGSEEESESENEFSYNSEEEEDDSDEEEHDEDEEESHTEDGEVDESGHPEEEEDDPTPVAASKPSQSTPEDEDSDEERRRQKRLFKKHLQQAANKIQAQWKKKAGLGSGGESDADRKASGDKPSAISPIRDRDAPSNASTPSNGYEKKKKKDGSSKSQTVPPPEPEVLQWNRGLSEKKSRKHVSTGLRVKVRFAAKVKRDGKVVKKKIWYGGRVSAVSKEGSKIRIKYDDGTSEISKFPDKDVVVDDTFNGKHLVPANKFIPPIPTESVEEEEEQEFDMDVDEPTGQPMEPKEEPKPKLSAPESQTSSEPARSTCPSSNLTKEKEEPSPPPPVVEPSPTEILEPNSEQMKDESSQPTASEVAAVENPSTSPSNFPSKPTENAADVSNKSANENAPMASPEDGEAVANSPKSSPQHEPGEIETPAKKSPQNSAEAEEPKASETEVAPTTAQDKSSATAEGPAADKNDEIPKEKEPEKDSEKPISPSATKPHLTIRISKSDLEQSAPKTPKVAGSDSEEELFADTPVTERKVKSIKLKGKGKRKREASQDGQPPKKKLNAKRAKLDEADTTELALPSLDTPIVEEPVTENEKAVPGAPSETTVAETEGGKMSNNAPSFDMQKDEAEEPPKQKKKKERASSPVPSGGKSPAAGRQSPVPTSQDVPMPDSTESQQRQDPPTPSPKSSKALKSIDEAATGLPTQEDDSSLPRSKGSVESLSAMRSGRKAAQQAKERMNPNLSEKKKKKRKRMEGEPENDHSDESVDDRQWVQCDSCRKWRILPSDVQVSSLPKHWYCHLNTYDPKRNNCNAPEQTAKQALKEWRKARKRAKQQRLAEMQAMETPEATEKDAQPDSKKALAGSTSPKSIKATKKMKLEAKRASPVGMDTVSSLPDLPKLEKKGKKGKAEQVVEEEVVAEPVAPAPAPEPEPPKKPGRKRGRPARNQTIQKETDDKDNVEWVQCEKCEKWRKLPPHISADELPDTWYCDMNTWNPESATCSAPEDKADATHHEVGTFAGMFGSGAGKYSYRALIFGTGKKHHRPMSERSRAAESLFMRPIDEVENPYPTVMYSKSSCFLPRTSNFTKANAVEEETPPSIFDVLSNSEMFAELRGVGQPMKIPEPGSGQALPKFITFENLPQDVKNAMREIVLRSLGSGTLSADELILTVMRFPWESISSDFETIREYFNADIIINSLLALVRDGVVEMTSFRNFKVPMDQWIPKYRKVRSVRAMQIEESIQKSRCMKIAKPWKQRESNTTEWVSGGAAFT